MEKLSFPVGFLFDRTKKTVFKNGFPKLKKPVFLNVKTGFSKLKKERFSKLKTSSKLKNHCETPNLIHKSFVLE